MLSPPETTAIVDGDDTLAAVSSAFTDATELDDVLLRTSTGEGGGGTGRDGTAPTRQGTQVAAASDPLLLDVTDIGPLSGDVSMMELGVEEGGLYEPDAARGSLHGGITFSPLLATAAANHRTSFADKGVGQLTCSSSCAGTCGARFAPLEYEGLLWPLSTDALAAEAIAPFFLTALHDTSAMPMQMVDTRPSVANAQLNIPRHGDSDLGLLLGDDDLFDLPTQENGNEGEGRGEENEEEEEEVPPEPARSSPPQVAVSLSTNVSFNRSALFCNRSSSLLGPQRTFSRVFHHSSTTRRRRRRGDIGADCDAASGDEGASPHLDFPYTVEDRNSRPEAQRSVYSDAEAFNSQIMFERGDRAKRLGSRPNDAHLHAEDRTI